MLYSLGLTLEQVRAAVVQVLVGAAPGPKGNVVMCRLHDQALDALDTLIEAGVRSTRSEAAAWLIQEGIAANHTLFAAISTNVAKIRRLREATQHLARQVTGESDAPASPALDESPAPDEGTRATPAE